MTAPFEKSIESTAPVGASEKGHDAGLTTILIGKLLSGDESTPDQLFRASEDLGFFYVDVRDLRPEK